jgi:hypothetical protein
LEPSHFNKRHKGWRAVKANALNARYSAGQEMGKREIQEIE